MDAPQPAGGSPAAPSPDNTGRKTDSSSTAASGAGAAQGPDALSAAAAAAEAANDSMLGSARGLWRDFSALAKDHLELVLLETQRAGKSAISMLVYAIAAALLLVTAWLGLLVALVIGLAQLGLHPGFGVLIVVALNLAGAFVLYRMIRTNSENLRFPATMRSLRNDAAAMRAPAARVSEPAPDGDGVDERAARRGAVS